MKYWLCVTNQKNWEVIREKNIWGVEERHRDVISKVRPGDRLLIYVMTTKKGNETLPPRIVAAYEAVSEMFIDSSRRFKGKLYPLRIRLRPIAIFPKPLDFRELVPKLGFIKNKEKWAGHIRGKAMGEIPERDFETVLEAAGVKGGVSMAEIEGVAFPIPKPFAQRFFEGKDVFVKPATVFKELKPGMRFVIYQSQEDTGFVGEARIKAVSFADDPMEFLRRYGERLFLSEQELKDYVKSQERWGKKKAKKRKWMAIELEDIRKYEKLVKPERPVPVGGIYLK